MKNINVPVYFQAQVLNARWSRNGYADAGWHLAIHLDEHVEQDELEGLATALSGDAPEVESRKWFKSALPGCAALIPTRRWASFLRGVELAVEQGRLTF